MHAEKIADEVEVEIETEGQEAAAAADDPAADAAATEVTVEAEELVVSLGDEPTEPVVTEKAPAWVRDLRKQQRELTKENKALKARLEAAGAPTESAAPRLPPKPKLEDSDFDAERHEAALDKWYADKSRIESAAQESERARKQQEDAEKAAWTAQLEKHAKSKAELPVKDYEDAEETAFSLLDQTQQGIIINYSDNSALLTYALGCNPAKLQSLAAIKDPGRFIREMTKLESSLKTSKRRPSTVPETRVPHIASGKSTTSAAGLEKLRAEAERTGNYTPVMQYKAEMKRRAASK